MKQVENGKPEFAGLRSRAETRVAKLFSFAESQSIFDANRLVHELRVHQIELELHNDDLRQAVEALEANNVEFYEFAPVGYSTIGRHGEIEKTNLTGADMLQQPRSALLGQRISSFMVTESIPVFHDFLDRVANSSEKESCLVTLKIGGHTPVAATVAATGIGADGACSLAVVTIESVEQANAALRTRQARLDLALAASDMGVLEWDRSTGKIYWSPECAKIFRDDSFGPTLDGLELSLHPQDLPRIKSQLRQMLAEGADQATECRVIAPDGEYVWLSVHARVQLDRSGTLVRLTGIVQDISKRKQSESACGNVVEALQTALDQSDSRRVAAQHLAFLERERRHIAAELHDGLGQSLSLLKLEIQTALRLMGDEVPPAALASVKRLLPTVAGAVDELRRVAIELRPSMLDDLGIVATINWFAREYEFAKQTTRVENEIGVAEKDVPHALKIVIFRILQEAVNNAFKYADASCIKISLHSADGKLGFAVEDDGEGFDPCAPTRRDDHMTGLGLQTMKERAELSGGTYALHSAIGQGTRDCVCWPASGKSAAT